MTVSIAEAHARLLGKMRAIVTGFVPGEVDALNAAMGWTGGDAVPMPADVRIGADGGDMVTDTLPLVVVIPLGADRVPESIADAQDFVAQFEVQVVDTYDGADPTRTVGRAVALLNVVVDCLTSRLPDYCTDNSGFIIRADVLATPAASAERVADSQFEVSAAGLISVFYRTERRYLPAYVAQSAIQGWVNTPLTQSPSSIVATGSGVAAVSADPGTSTTLALTAAQLAATTAVTVTFPTGALPNGSAVTWYRQGAGYASAATVSASDAASMAVGTMPAVDGAEYLVIGVAGGTLTPYAYRYVIEVIP